MPCFGGSAIEAFLFAGELRARRPCPDGGNRRAVRSPRVNFAEREQSDAYRALNPKAKVPALQRDDGSVLTEYQAISVCLALTHPEKRLIPLGVERHARMMEAMEYVVGTIHGSGFRRVFRPTDFTRHEADHDAVKAQGLMIARDGLTAGRQGPRVERLHRRRFLDRRSGALLCELVGRRTAEDRPADERPEAL